MEQGADEATSPKLDRTSASPLRIDNKGLPAFEIRRRASLNVAGRSGQFERTTLTSTRPLVFLTFRTALESPCEKCAMAEVPVIV